MKTITTNSNIVTEITYTISGYTPSNQGWRIDSVLTQRSLVGAAQISRTTRSWVLIDTDDALDFTNFISSWTTVAELHEATIAKIVELANIVEWEDPTDGLLTPPDATAPKPWEAGETVAPTMIREYDGIFYEVVQLHTTQIGWEPPKIAALFKLAQDQGGTGYPAWVQPVGAQDAYPLGARVTHNGLCWESVNDANVWEPGAFGWIEIPCN